MKALNSPMDMVAAIVIGVVEYEIMRSAAEDNATRARIAARDREAITRINRRCGVDEL